MSKDIQFPAGNRVKSEFTRVSVSFPVLVDGVTVQCIVSGELLGVLNNCGFTEGELVKAGMDNIRSLHDNARRLIEASQVADGEVLITTKTYQR